MACDELPNDKPYWNYEDIGVFFLVLVLIGFALRLLVRFHLLPRSELNNPSVLLQFLLSRIVDPGFVSGSQTPPSSTGFALIGVGLATSGLCDCRPDRGSVTGLRRCALFALLPSQHAADWPYRAAISGRFTWPNS